MHRGSRASQLRFNPSFCGLGDWSRASRQPIRIGSIASHPPPRQPRRTKRVRECESARVREREREAVDSTARRCARGSLPPRPCAGPAAKDKHCPRRRGIRQSWQRGRPPRSVPRSSSRLSELPGRLDSGPSLPSKEPRVEGASLQARGDRSPGANVPVEPSRRRVLSTNFLPVPLVPPDPPY
jgi:hypothetical protein